MNQRPVGGPLDLLDGIDGRHAHDGRAMFDHRVDSPLDGGGVDQRAHSVVHQNNIVRLGGKSGHGVGNRLLAIVAAFHHVDLASEAVLGNLGLDALDLRLAHGHKNGRHARHRSKGAQRMNQDGDPVKRQKLFGLRPGHTSSKPGGGKNHKYLHIAWSIQRMA